MTISFKIRSCSQYEAYNRWEGLPDGFKAKWAAYQEQPLGGCFVSSEELSGCRL